MASMKDYLEKAMLRLGSRGAMPGGGVINVVSSDKSGLDTPFIYYAPDDGYICAYSKNGGPAGVLHLYNRTSGTIFSAYQPASVNARTKAVIAAKKGDRLEVSSYQSNFVVNVIQFIKSVGGGLKRLIQKVFYLGGRYGFA